MTRVAPDRLIGRATEVKALVARVRDAAMGRLGLVHLRPKLPGGVGTSSLLELFRRALGDEATVLLTTCAENGTDYDGVRGLFGADAERALAAVPDAGPVCRGLSRLVSDLAATRPLVLVLDDAHHCDPATARWLGLLARRAAGLPVCLVLSAAFDSRAVVELLFGELTGALDGVVLELGPFTEAEVREQALATFGVAPHEDFVRVCMEICLGHPEGTSRWMARFREEGRLPDAATAALFRTEVAAEARSRIMAWLAEDADVRRYATAVAVIGHAGAVAVDRLCELDPRMAESARDMLAVANVLDENGRYRSVEFRDAVLALSTQEELDDLRYRGSWFLWDEDRPAPEIADLLVPISELTRECSIFTLRRAASMSPPDAAVTYLRRALKAVPGSVDVRLELANVMVDIDFDAACDLYADVLPDIEDSEALEAAVTRYGVAAMVTGRTAEGFEVLARVRPNVSDRVPVEAMMLQIGQCTPGTLARALELARDIEPPSDPGTSGRQLAGQLAMAEVLTGERVGRALDLARSALPNGSRAYWDSIAVMVLHHCGETAEAMERLDLLPDRGGLAVALRAYVRIECGDLAEAVQDAEKAFLIADLPFNRAMLAYALVCRGENDRAEPLLAGLEVSDLLGSAVAIVARARWSRNRGDHEAALAELLHCGREFERWGVTNPMIVPWWIDAVTVLVELGRTAEARELADRFQSPKWDTAQARGYALLAVGLTTGEIEPLEQAVTELSAAGARLQQIQALLALGNALLRQGDDRTARTHLRAAVDLAVRCGDGVAAQSARDALSLAGGRMSSVSETPLQTLTAGQRRVAEMVAEGLTNREIAEALFVTVRAVESHLSNAYRKLGVRTRAELAALVR